MRFVTVGNGRVYEVPETWVEAEKMLLSGVRYNDKRGGNLAQQSIAARIAYGMFHNDGTLPDDPTAALMNMMWKICQRRGAGLES